MLHYFPLGATWMRMSLKRSSAPSACWSVNVHYHPVSSISFRMCFSNGEMDLYLVISQEQNTACFPVCIWMTVYVCVMLAGPYSCEISCHLGDLFKGSGADTHSDAHIQRFSVLNICLFDVCSLFVAGCRMHRCLLLEFVCCRPSRLSQHFEVTLTPTNVKGELYKDKQLLYWYNYCC